MNGDAADKGLSLALGRGLTEDQARTLDERRQRRQRIDALAPDRSWLVPLDARYWLRPSPPEALVVEGDPWKEDAEASERLEAMRGLIKKKKAGQ